MQDVAAEFESLVLPDKRLVERVRKFIRLAWSSPSESLPQMLQDAAQLEGAYRLLNNDRVSFGALLAPHASNTCARAEQAGDVVVAHDWSTIETPYAAPEDVGYLPTGAAGYHGHFSLALQVEPGRPARPLGVLSVQADFRTEAPKYDGKKKKYKTSTQTARSTDKAFLRWERGIEASALALQGCASVVHVADREADSYPLFCKVLQLGHGCVFRLRNDRRARCVDDDDNMLDEDWSRLSDILSEMQGQFECTVPLSKRGAKSAPASKKAHPPRESRNAQLHYSATQVELRRPHYQPATLPQSLRVWLVRAWEPTPPDGQQAVDWVLLTTEPCTTAAEIMRVVDLYRSRWLIEDFFKALKTVCKLEERQFESRRALLNVLALFIPIAVHLLWLRTCARDTPDVPATEVFSPLQLQVLAHLSPRKMPPSPTAVQAIWVLAGYGGHISNNGWPGTQVLGRAFVRLVEAVATWQTLQAKM